MRRQSCTEHGHWESTCPPCRQAKRDYMNDYRHSQYRGDRLSYPAEICGQRLRELRAYGYSIRDLAERCHLPRKTVWLLCEGDQGWVQLGTFQGIAAAYTELRDWPGPSTYARNSAVKRGWTPPALPDAPATVNEELVDEVAVQRATAGDQKACLTGAELAVAWRILEQRGMSAAGIARTLGVTERTIQRLRSGATVKPYPRRTG